MLTYADVRWRMLQVVKPHAHFMLFATQNPAGGAYGGRKVMSRAFRNRFLEVRMLAYADVC